MKLKDRTEAITMLVQSVKENVTDKGIPVDYTAYIGQIVKETNLCAICNSESDMVGICMLDNRGIFHGTCNTCKTLPNFMDKLKESFSKGDILFHPPKHSMH